MTAIRPFVPSDLDRLELQACQRDWLAAEGITVDARYGQMLADCGPAWTVVDGDRLLGCAGFAEAAPHWAIVWALLAASVGRGMVAFTRAARERLAAAPYRRVDAMVRSDFEQGRRWAEMIGLKRHTTIELWGPLGVDHELYEQVRR